MDDTPNAETTRRARLEARTALGDLRHSMDISTRDIEADRARWKAVEDELTVLVALAYLRNHNQ